MRELIVQTRSTEPAHLRSARLRASDIEALYRIDEALAAPEAGLVVVVDDLLTSGAHFRAAQRVLSRRFADIDVAGLFLARRAKVMLPRSFPRVACLGPHLTQRLALTRIVGMAAKRG